MSDKRYIVAAIHEWNKVAFEKNHNTLPGQWDLIQNKADLTLEFVLKAKPEYIFFPHWSWKVPAEILAASECVCFHMTDVPYGRGGSPLQNLIARGHTQTKLTALRMVEEMDAGPVYLKQDISLEGSAHEIYARAAMLSYQMMREILSKKIVPVDQVGEPTIFSRRTPEQSRIGESLDMNGIYDQIRMLDALGYPHAFIDSGTHRIEFTNVQKIINAEGQEMLQAKAVFHLRKVEPS